MLTLWTLLLVSFVKTGSGEWEGGLFVLQQRKFIENKQDRRTKLVTLIYSCIQPVLTHRGSRALELSHKKAPMHGLPF